MIKNTDSLPVTVTDILPKPAGHCIQQPSISCLIVSIEKKVSVY